MQKLIDGFGLLEGPLWTGESLVFSDASGGGLWRWAGQGPAQVVLPHRRGMAGVARHADGGYVVSGRNVSYKTPEVTKTLFEHPLPRRNFNDLTTDPAGRIYVGSVAGLLGQQKEGPGELYVIDLDGSVHPLADDVLLSNGLSVSADGRRLYHADSLRKLVWVYERSEDGSVGGRDVLVSLDEGTDAVPDGLALAEDGSVWIAMAHGGCVLQVAPDGQLLQRIPVPSPTVTSVAFGGQDMRDLFITTGPAGAPEGEGGALYVERTAVAGLCVHPARVLVPAEA